MWFHTARINNEINAWEGEGTKSVKPLFLHLPPNFCTALMCSSEKETEMSRTGQEMSSQQVGTGCLTHFYVLASQQLWRMMVAQCPPCFQPGILVLLLPLQTVISWGTGVALIHKCLQVFFKSRGRMLWKRSTLACWAAAAPKPQCCSDIWWCMYFASGKQPNGILVLPQSSV